MDNVICHLCGEPILETEQDATYENSIVHLDCLHDVMCPNEEMERL